MVLELMVDSGGWVDGWQKLHDGGASSTGSFWSVSKCLRGEGGVLDSFPSNR